MRFTYIKLKGYVGIYNGLGLDELEIDLSKCRHKICTIIGINGCGKSTLLNALTILPDGSENFIPGVNASKDLQLVDGNNTYDIKITSAASKNGRGLSKASIKKNGIELNPNGNIGSYKEIIYQEFELDSNYITLCRLSSEDRGIADKTPADRKKMVAFVVDSLDTYNAIYKNLNKKALVFRSYINNLHTKIQNVGNEDNIRGTLSVLQSKHDNIKQQIDALNTKIVELTTLLKVYDPDNKIQERYQQCHDDVEQKTQNMNDKRAEMVHICQRLGIESSQEAIEKFYKQTSDVLNSHQQNMSIYNASRLALVEKNESLSRSIENNNRKIDSLSEGIDPDLRNAVKMMKDKVDNERYILKKMGVTNPDNVSREELKLTFDTTLRIISMIDDLYYEMDETLMEEVFSFNPASMRNMATLIENKRANTEDLRKRVDEVKADQEVVSILTNRPEACTIDDCYFIKKAYSLYQSKYSEVSVEQTLSGLLAELQSRLLDLDDLTNTYNHITVVYQKYEKLNLIRSVVDTNRDILSKSSICSVLVDEYEDRIRCMRSFNDFRDLESLVDQVNVVSVYKDDISIYRQLSADLDKQNNSEVMVKQFKEENDELIKELTDVKVQLSEFENKVKTYSDLIDTFSTKLNLAENAREACKAWLVAVDDVKKANAIFDEALAKSRSSVKTLEDIQDCTNEKANLQMQLSPIETQISTEQGKLLMLESYKEEYNTYSEKFNYVDTLKKYSSPTTGIQTLFMNIYMSKTLDLANKVLSMIFGGRYQLLDYIINANEFKIPFIGEGLRVDDISSGSTSQICMMGMVLNLVLKYQASNKYNIASLDEIDGGLDTRNRLSYVAVLDKLIEILELDQVFVISHSMELESSNVDVIVLKQYQDYGESVSIGGNVIYDFNKIQH